MDTLYGTPFGPHWTPGRNRAVPNQNLRVSDAERAKVGDELSRHYADGRLDEAEFNERLGKAMSAKTRGDLAGLLSDLPQGDPSPPPAGAGNRRRSRVGLFLLAFVVAAAWLASWHVHVGFLLLVVVGLLAWRRHHRHVHRCHGHGTDTGEPASGGWA